MSLGNMYPTIVALVLVGVILGVGLYVLVEFRDNIATEYTGSDTLEVVNGTTGAANTTTLSDSTKDDYKLVSVDSVINGTGAGTFTNYTYESNGIITWGADISAQAWSGGDATVNISSTYIYDVADSAEESVNDTMEGLADLAEWIAIIVVVIAAAIVLGIVLRSFGRQPGV